MVESNEKLLKEINLLKIKGAEIEGNVEIIKEKTMAIAEKTLSLQARNIELKERMDEYKANSIKQAEKELQELMEFENKMKNLTESLAEITTKELSDKKLKDNAKIIDAQKAKISELSNCKRYSEMSFDEQRHILEMVQQKGVGLMKLVESLSKQKMQLLKQIQTTNAEDKTPE